MLSHQDNELLTRVGAGTPMGSLMRRYWIPAAFSNQIEKPDSPPVRVRLLGENLVLFRDTQGPNGGPQLWSVDITGYNEQRVPIEGLGSDPAWSPKLN